MLDEKTLVSLLVSCKSGDNSAFSQLVYHYTPLIRTLLAKYGLDDAEFYSDACMSLYRAAQSFDLDQSSVTFGLYAQICMSRRLSELACRDRREEERISDLDVDAIAVPGNIDARLVQKEESEGFRMQARALLSEYEYDIFIMWLEGNKTAQIASSLGKSAKSVDNAKARILKKLRDGLPPPGA